MQGTYPRGGSMRDIFAQGRTIPVSNPTYPMANLNGSSYAAPLMYNRPTETLGGYDAQINPMTGQEVTQTNFAHGGQIAPQAGIASLLASHGRGGDSTLVHMTPNEVNNLRSLAAATGNEMTVNPHTGLYEANWLEKLLPTIIGGGLTVLSGGALSPLAAGLITGTAYGAIKGGDLSQGLMAGLGAYGGAGLTGSIANAGAAATKAAAEKAAMSSVGTNAGAGAVTTPPTATTPAVPAVAPTAIPTAAKPTLENLQAGLGSMRTLKSAKDVFTPLSLTQKAGLATAALGALTPDQEELKKKSSQYYIGGGYDPQYGFGQGYFTSQYPGMAAGGSVRNFADGGYTGYDPYSTYGSTPTASNRIGYFNTPAGPLYYVYTGPGQFVFYDPKGNQIPSYGIGRGIRSGRAVDYNGQELKFIFNDSADPDGVATLIPLEGRYGTSITPDEYYNLVGGQTGSTGGTGGTGGTGPTGTQAPVKFISAYDPMFSASNAAYIGTPKQQLGAYLQSLRKSLVPGETSVYDVTKGAGSGEPIKSTTPVKFASAYDPTSSAGNYGYTGTTPEQVKSYLGELNQSLTPGEVRTYELSTGATSAPPYSGKASIEPPGPDVGGLQFDASSYDTGLAGGGLAGLRGTYKAGGKLLRGPGDGMSDSIPAVIHGEKTQRAALADGEFVVPADVVSHLGNGSTDAGSRKLYEMMDRVRKARTGRTRQAPAINPDKYTPA